VQTYRAYLLDDGGRIQRGDWIEANNENEALAKAKELWRNDGPRIEVWLGAKKLCEASVPVSVKLAENTLC
jgi:hypothetical protein